jgi:hypothetical protein
MGVAHIVDNRISEEGDSNLMIKRRNRLLCGIGMLLVLATTIASPIQACLNDSDVITLAEASKSIADPKALGAGLPDMVWIITGRFERNPDLYYAMRIERVKKELIAHPQQLDLYDDIAVAYDRLHKDDDAIVWIEKKKAQLERVAPKENIANAEHKEQWYRYHANIGTFYAHRWLKNKDRKNMADMQTGFNHIARGLEIKPDAHFGREPVQLAAMEWILSGCKESFSNRLKSYNTDTSEQTITEKSIEYRFTYRYLHNTEFNHFNEEKMRTGLSGLIVLGAAWESIDVFKALAEEVQLRYIDEGMGVINAPMSDFALWRTEELRKKGRASMEVSEQVPAVTPDPLLKKQFHMPRADADRWQENRTAYMMTRLQQGKHPDTNPDFWKAYKERPKPSLEMSKEDAAQWRAEHPKPRTSREAFTDIQRGLLGFVGVGILWGIFRKIRRTLLFAKQRT